MKMHVTLFYPFLQIQIKKQYYQALARKKGTPHPAQRGCVERGRRTRSTMHHPHAIARNTTTPRRTSRPGAMQQSTRTLVLQGSVLTARTLKRHLPTTLPRG